MLTTVAGATSLYRWVDEQGRVNYSDRPREGAEVVEIESPTTHTPPAAATAPPLRRPAPATTEAATKTYQSVSIQSPTSDQVLWNIGGVLTVTLSISPKLHEGHKVVVRYDGAVVEDWPPQATAHAINDVYRGTHTVAAEVTDANGKVMIAGQPVTFHVKQTSVLN